MKIDDKEMLEAIRKADEEINDHLHQLAEEISKE